MVDYALLSFVTDVFGVVPPFLQVLMLKAPFDLLPIGRCHLPRCTAFDTENCVNF